MSNIVLATSDESRSVPSGSLAFYARTDDLLYMKDDSGSECRLLTSQDVTLTMGSGTTFPATPSPHDHYYRTDRHMLYAYNSTLAQWHTVQEYAATFTPQRTVEDGLPANYTWGKLVLLPRFASPARVRLTRLDVLCFVATTNNATNYWTIGLEAGSGGTIASLTTASEAVNTDLALTWSAGDNLASTENRLLLTVTKTGTPGTMYIDSGMLFFRYAE